MRCEKELQLFVSRKIPVILTQSKLQSQKLNQIFKEVINLWFYTDAKKAISSLLGSTQENADTNTIWLHTMNVYQD